MSFCSTTRKPEGLSVSKVPGGGCTPPGYVSMREGATGKKRTTFLRPAYLSLGNIWSLWATNELKRRSGLWRMTPGNWGQISDPGSLTAGFLFVECVAVCRVSYTGL